jgi:hypothetical protein
VRKLTPLEQQQFQMDPRLNGNPDTLRFVQLTQSANASFNILLSNPSNNKRKSNLNVNLTYQTSGEKQGEGNTDIAKGTNFYNGSISLMQSSIPQVFSSTFSFNTNYSALPQSSSLIMSPSITVSKGFLNKTIRPTATITWNRAYSNGKKVNDTMNFRFGSGYTYKKKHTITTNLTVVSKNPLGTTSDNTSINNDSFTEYTWNLGYSFQF